MEASDSSLQNMQRLLTSRMAVYIYFALILALGIVIAKDYGISWDEKAMYVLGENAYGYVLGTHPYPSEPGIRFHGAWFEIAQYAVQELLGLRFARAIFIMRHMLNFLTFWIGLIAIYAIALRTFRSRTWALVTMLMLLLSPRQFGHAFFNGRDIPAMAFFTVKMLALLYFLDRPSFKRAVILGLASGLVITLRVGLLFLPLYAVLFVGLKMLADFDTDGYADWKRYGKLFGAYCVAFAISIVAFWPLLWEHPLQNLATALHNMLWEQQAAGGFYFGENIGALPWHWVPVHIVSKTPLLYVALATIAIISFIIVCVRRPSSLLTEHRDTLLFFLWFVLPIFSVIVLHASMFDEWRHLYFIYPAFLLLAVTALRGLYRSLAGMRPVLQKILRWGLTALCAVSFLSSALWMVRNHPLQYVYFSLPSGWIEGKFELDYWGLSYRQGFEWILEHDPGDPVSVSVTASPGWENLNILTQEQRRRLLVRKQFDTKYVLDNFRWHGYHHDFPEEAKVHSIYVAGMEVLGIYRNPLWKPEWDRDEKRMEDYEVQFHFDPSNKGFFE